MEYHIAHQMTQHGPNLDPKVPILGYVGAILGLRETYVGQFLGPFLRAKNYVIFSTKKLGLERPYVGPILGHVGLLGAMLGPSWAYVRPMLGNFWALFFALKIM